MRQARKSLATEQAKPDRWVRSRGQAVHKQVLLWRARRRKAARLALEAAKEVAKAEREANGIWNIFAKEK